MFGQAVYLALAGLFWAASRLLYDIHIEEEEATTFPPATLVVANHKRDLDSVILPAALYWLQRPPRAWLQFAGREDMFSRGFLAGYDVVPLWLRRLLYEIDLTPVMHALRIHPVRRFPERTMDEALREARLVLGDRPLGELLLPGEAAPVVRRMGPQARLSEALRWEFREWRSRPARMTVFQSAARARLQERQHEVVRAQMQTLAGILNHGGVLYLAPEGVISPDGRLQAFRAGLAHILSLASVPRVRPVCIAYDFMKPGPLRVFIATGRLFAPAGAPDAVAALVRRRLAALHTIAASQICSQVIWDGLISGRPGLDVTALSAAASALAAALVDEGLRVERGFSHAVRDRVSQWVAYAVRREILIPEAAGLRIDPSISRRPATHWGNPVRYCVNELRSVRAALRGDTTASAAAG